MHFTFLIKSSLFEFAMPTMKLKITIYRDKLQLKDVNDKFSSKL